MENRKGMIYLLLSICSYVIILLEAILAYTIEPLYFHKTIDSWDTINFIFHWISICVVWLILSVLLILFAKKKGYYVFSKGDPINSKQLFIIITGIVFCFVVSYINWNGFKIVQEYKHLGLLKFIFQYLYYAVETLLYNLIIIYSQKAFEIWFHKTNIPYGGLFVALTWGLGHFFTKDYITGLLTVITGLLFGMMYLLTNRDTKKTYLITLLMFVL